ncbi:type I CRISPR-associated protein Cas7 [Methylosinus sp. Ce-a6]|uniref:type I CRISPR-associated protein Cas7 n=1 Tax=Methylosinus sp. Ce-a6 TaxID=2172005 RepID=UPI0034D481B4
MQKRWSATKEVWRRLERGELEGSLLDPPAIEAYFKALFWRKGDAALDEMFDHDRSAARGEMTARRLVVFEHESDLGNASAAKLLERVKISRAPGSDGPPRSFSDYAVEVQLCAQGVALQEMFGVEVPEGAELIAA